MITTTHKKILSNTDFGIRMLKFFMLASFFIALSLGMGVAGYHYFGHLNLVDSFYNACMILTGMGPVDKMPNDAAKLFSSFYSLYSGIAFLTTVALFISPVVHRALHFFHLDEKDK
jgi:hypothetical protein